VVFCRFAFWRAIKTPEGGREEFTGRNPVFGFVGNRRQSTTLGCDGFVACRQSQRKARTSTPKDFRPRWFLSGRQDFRKMWKNTAIPHPDVEAPNADPAVVNNYFTIAIDLRPFCL